MLARCTIMSEVLLERMYSQSFHHIKTFLTGQVLHENAVTTSVPWQGRKVLCASKELILRVFLYGILSVVACTLLCESGSTGSIPVGYPNLSVV